MIKVERHTHRNGTYSTVSLCDGDEAVKMAVKLVAGGSQVWFACRDSLTAVQVDAGITSREVVGDGNDRMEFLAFIETVNDEARRLKAEIEGPP